MTDETVKQLATEINTSVERLIQQFSYAGIQKTENDFITEKEKKILLSYLNKHNKIECKNTNTNKLILQRKTKSVLSILSPGGKSKSVNIEIRKKHTYTDHDLIKTPNAENNINNINTIVTKNKIIHKTKHDEKLNTIQHIESNEKLKNNLFINKPIKYNEEQNIKNKILKTQLDDEKNISNKIDLDIKITRKKNKKSLKENYKNWINNEHFNNKKYYHTNFSNLNEEEDNENNIKEKERYTKNKNWKTIKQKKNNKQHIHVEYNSLKNNEYINKTKSKQQQKISLLQQSFTKPIININRDIVIGEYIAVNELANKMAIKSSQVIKTMMKMGFITTINQIIDQETAQLVAEEMGHKVTLLYENKLETDVLNDRGILHTDIPEPRSPIVTIMGHVDHGKTTLLDYIRSSKIALNEAGGITQHIQAYNVKTKYGSITFLDTPGHSAFTAMRIRGIKLTDIVILVIAADDGVMPQTIEAIQHAKIANVPIIVAINKIDKEENNIEKIKNELSKYDILCEEWGGDNQFINISAKNGTGINSLLEAVIVQAEMMELKAIKNGMASGVVIESHLDKGEGPIATILIKEGTIKKGDVVLCGIEYGRIRNIRNEFGKYIQTSGPSLPIEVIGLSNTPVVGETAIVVRNEKIARDVASYRQKKNKELKLSDQKKINLKNIFTEIKETNYSELKIILKTDVQGTCEAITESLNKLSTDKIKIKILYSGVGGITETDVSLASTSNAIIIGFNVRSNNIAKKIAEKEKINLRYYSIIYNVLNDIKSLITGMLSPKYKEIIIGIAEIRNIFKLPKLGIIAGCMIVNGVIKRNNPIRLLRNNIVIYQGEIDSLRHFKNDVHELRNGMECGIVIKNYNNINIGDIIEMFETIKI